MKQIIAIAIFGILSFSLTAQTDKQNATPCDQQILKMMESVPTVAASMAAIKQQGIQPSLLLTYSPLGDKLTAKGKDSKSDVSMPYRYAIALGVNGAERFETIDYYYYYPKDGLLKREDIVLGGEELVEFDPLILESIPAVCK